MESKTNYTLIGILVLLFSTVVIITGLWLSVGLHSTVYNTYASYMNEPVFGLSVQSPVKFNGVSVGFVKNIAINRSDPQQVLILMDIEQNTPITTSTTSVLQSQGITGLRYIELSVDQRNSEPLIPIPGEQYPVIPSRPSLLVQLDLALKDITENFATVSSAVNQVLDKENSTSIKNSLRNIEHVTSVLSNQASNTAELLDNLSQASKGFPQAIQDISKGAVSLRLMSDSVYTAGRKMSKTMDYGRQAIKQLSEQTMPQVTSLLEKLGVIARNANSLTKELKTNPAMLLRGKQPPKLGPGEK